MKPLFIILLTLSLFACGGGDYSQQHDTKLLSTGSETHRIIMIGDSRSDAGTYKQQAIALGSPEGGKFTVNPSPMWIEIVAEHYGQSLIPNRYAGFGITPVQLGGNDYAEGGAQVLLPTSTPGGQSSMPIVDQISAYLPTARTTDLVFVWAGSPDVFLSFGKDDFRSRITNAAIGLAQQIARLKDAGIERVYVLNLDDFGKAPQFVNDTLRSGPATDLTISFNNQFLAAIQNVNGVTILDIFGLLSQVRNAPTMYGLSNVTDTACDPSVQTIACAGFADLTYPNAERTYMYSDGIHFAPPTNKIIADYVLKFTPQ